jgi:hypothetical protein
MKFKYHKDGTTPINGEIFVFGSNLSAIHGAGAAKEAAKNFGASRYVNAGFSGNSYAIPTKDAQIKTLDIEIIRGYIKMFIVVANEHPEKTFFVTRIGCFLAGYDNKDIAPMFKDCNPKNCSFAEEWLPYLELNIEQNE